MSRMYTNCLTATPVRNQTHPSSHREYVKVEVLSGVAHPISVWIRVEHCDDKCGIVYGVVDDEQAPDLGKALKSGARLAAGYRQVRERRAA
jgi:hypothetical protein